MDTKRVWIKIMGILLAVILTVESGASGVLAAEQSAVGRTETEDRQSGEVSVQNGVTDSENVSNQEFMAEGTTAETNQESMAEGTTTETNQAMSAGESGNGGSQDASADDSNLSSEGVQESSCIAIDERNFPDRGLRSAIAELADQDGDALLSEEELAAVTALDLTGKNIYDLTGLAYFTQLSELNVSWNHLTGEDVKPYENLTEVIYYNNTYLAAESRQITEQTVEISEETAGPSETSDVQNTTELTDTPEPTDTQEMAEKPWKYTYISVTSAEYYQTAEALPIVETLFPDEKLRSMIADVYDTDQDGILSVQEQEQVTSLYLRDCEITDLTGIGCFKNLLLLDCTANQLTSLDMSQWKELRGLSCRENQLTTLDITANEKLRQLECDENVQVIRRDETEPQELLEAEQNGQEAAAGAAEEASVTAEVKSVRTFTITFQSAGGSAVAAQTVAAGNCVTKPAHPTRRKYVFKGWYRGKKKYNFSRKVNSNLTLTAKWTKVSVSKTSIKRLKNTKKGVLGVYYKKVKGAKGYDVQIATNKRFKKGLVRKNATKTSRGFTGLKKNKTYYVRVRAYKLDSQRKRVYGKFSKVKKLKITKGITAVAASKNAVTLTSVALTSTGNIRIQASAPNTVKSVDNNYYLFTLTATEGTMSASRKPIAQSKKKSSLTFDVPLYYNTANDRLQRKFAIGVKSSSSPERYTLVSERKFISNPEVLAVANQAFPTASTKKGLQVNEFYIQDAVDLGVKHTTYNMCLDDIIAEDSEKNNARGISYSFDGNTYWFDRGIIESYDRTLNSYKSNNMVVSAIILLRYRPDLTYLMTSGNYQSGYYALKTTTDKARKQLAATFTFLAARYATNGRIANWIIGNEVNNYGSYQYTGSSNLSSNARTYANSFRLAYIAIRSVYSQARLYISLDHLWNTLTSVQHSSKAFLDKFAGYLDGYGHFNIAYHAYPSPLTAPEFWANSNKTLTNTVSSPCITMGNISVLTNYVKNHYGSGTRIILSEQGFTSKKLGQDVQKRQAAAIAYAYYLAEFNPMIDAFILHRQIDHQAEINQGLALGLWSNQSGTVETPGSKKYAWDVFKYMDTSQGTARTKFALNIIGKASWKLAVPGYNASRFK